MKTLITLSSWNRPIYLYRVLDGLKRCRGLNKFKLLISCDFYDKNNSQQILETIELSQIQYAVETEAIFHEENLGCTGNGRFCLEEGFKNEQDYTIHLECDTYPSIDLLEYFEQTAHLLDEYFAVCTFNRGCHQLIAPTPSDSHKLFAKKWFEGCGGFAINRKTWNRIKELGGLFGVEYIPENAKKWDCRGEEWKNKVTISDRLAYDWSMDRYFSEDKFCLYPLVSRVFNIGKSGLHLNFNQYMELQYNENWVHNPYYINRIMETTWFDLDVRKDEEKYIENGIYYA